MPQHVPEKITFLTNEITGLQARMVTMDNAVQHSKLDMLKDIRSDYEKSVAASKAREAEQQ